MVFRFVVMSVERVKVRTCQASERRMMVEIHSIELYHREFDQITGSRDHRAACDPCKWMGPWRVAQDTAQNDGALHCKTENRHTRIIERSGRRFEVYAYEKKLWLNDICSKCRRPISGGGLTTVIRGRSPQKASARLERAIRRRLRRSPSKCRRCDKVRRFDINEVLEASGAEPWMAGHGSNT